jgi:hypothetical protein
MASGLSCKSMKMAAQEIVDMRSGKLAVLRNVAK